MRKRDLDKSRDQKGHSGKANDQRGKPGRKKTPSRGAAPAATPDAHSLGQNSDPSNSVEHFQQGYVPSAPRTSGQGVNFSPFPTELQSTGYYPQQGYPQAWPSAAVDVPFSASYNSYTGNYYNDGCRADGNQTSGYQVDGGQASGCPPTNSHQLDGHAAEGDDGASARASMLNPPGSWMTQRFEQPLAKRMKLNTDEGLASVYQNGPDTPRSPPPPGLDTTSHTVDVDTWRNCASWNSQNTSDITPRDLPPDVADWAQWGLGRSGVDGAGQDATAGPDGYMYPLSASVSSSSTNPEDYQGQTQGNGPAR